MGVLFKFSYMCLINLNIVISHIGETYSKYLRGQARLRGYDPTTYL